MSRKLLHVGPKLALPALEAQTQTFVVYGGKGMGKTNFGAVFVEELDKRGLRFAFIDPVGVAWGIKHSADGRGPGIEVLILGGTHGDLPIEPTAGALVADLVVDEEVSVLIDISRRPNGTMWSQGERIRFVRDYCIRLFARQGERRRPLMQIIDECGRFAPEQATKNDDAIMECIGAIEQLVELGRNVGVGVTLLTQRSARMRKSVSELADTMIGFRVVGPRSIKAIIDWFGDHVPREQTNVLVEQLRQLERGTALVVSPGWLRLEGAYAVRARETFDSSATPVAGVEPKPRGKGAQIDRAKYEERLAEVVERAKAADPRELRKGLSERDRRIAALEQQLRERPDAQVEPERVEVEVPVIPEELARAIVGLNGTAHGLAGNLREDADRLEQAAQAVVDLLPSTRETSKVPVADLRAPQPRAQVQRPVPGPRTKPTPRRPAPPPRSPAPSATNGDLPDLTGPQQKILDALAWLHAVGFDVPTKGQVGFIAGYRTGKKVGGHYANLLGGLVSAGLIHYPRQGHAALTDAGQEVAVAPDIEPTTEGLQRTIFARLDGPEQRILQELVAVYPDALTKQEVGERAGYNVGEKIGGHFANLLGRLRSLGLIDYPEQGYAAAEPILFLEERSLM